MKILFRYVLREFSIPLVYCLAGFCGIYVLFELFGSFSRIVDARLPLKAAAEYFAGYLSPFFHYLAPAALMLAALYTMWSLGRRSELVAMRAGGVGLAAIARPMMLVAVAVAGLTAWVDECYMPRRAAWAKRLRAARFDLEKTADGDGFAFCNTKDRRTWSVERGGELENGVLRGVRISCDRADGSRIRTVSAPVARFLDGEWWLEDATCRHYGPGGRLVASSTPALDALPLRAFPEFTETPADMLMQNDDARYASVAGKLRYAAANRDLSGEARDSIIYDAWAQAVAPFACIAITLLSIPAGMATGRQAVFSGVLGAISLFVAYYGFVIGCMVLAKTSAMPPVPAALLPPVLFAFLGVFHCRKTMKATLVLAVVSAVLLAIYAATAAALENGVVRDRAMAHCLAATLPAMAAVAAAFAAGRGNTRT